MPTLSPDLMPDANHAPDLARRHWLSSAASGLAGTAVATTAATTAGCATPGSPLATAYSAGKIHVVECNRDTVRVGLLDPHSPPAATIDSGDIVHYPNTWLNWANEPRYGMSFAEREPIRRRYPDGPYSNIGPVFIRDAQPGDLVEIRTLRARPIAWGWNSSPANVGAIPEDFDKPYLKYYHFDADRRSVEFAPGIRLELHPGQGMFATQPPGDKPVSAILNGPYGGKLGLHELVVGTALFLPVFHPGARVWTSNSHAVQGDGMVNQTALETAMEDLRIQYILHRQTPIALPTAETPTHWIGVGFGRTLDDALVSALRGMISWISGALAMDRADAYALFSLAGSFRATKFARQRGSVYTEQPAQTLHAMLPKSILSPAVQQQLSASLRRSRA